MSRMLFCQAVLHLTVCLASVFTVLNKILQDMWPWQATTATVVEACKTRPIKSQKNVCDSSGQQRY